MLPVDESGRTGDLIVMSRLLVVQSKRLLLASAQLSLDNCATDERRQRVTCLHADVERADGLYRQAVLDWASPQSGQFWLTVYWSLIDRVEVLAQKLRNAAAELPDIDRIEMLTDVANLDSIIERWRTSMAASRREDAA